LQGERALALQFLPAKLAAAQQLGLTVLGLLQIAGRAFHATIHLLRQATKPLVLLGDQLGERHFDMSGDALDLRGTFLANLIEKRQQHIFLEPCGGFGC
jgi:hypothetical protein